MKVVILEDENVIAKRLEVMLARYDPGIRVLATLPSVSKARQWLNVNPAPDLMFMDIHLEDDLVFELFRQMDITTPVIFTTAYDEYVIQALKVSSIDYLLKPVQYEDMVTALGKYKAFGNHFRQSQQEELLRAIAQMNGQPYKERFMVTVGTKIHSIAVADIAYFFLEDKLAYLTTTKGASYPVNFSLDALTHMLDPKQFFRINRQYFVAHTSLRIIHTYSAGKLKLELQPEPRHEVFVSGDRMADFKEWLGK